MNGRGAIPVDGFVLLTYIPLKGLIVLYKGKDMEQKVYCSGLVLLRRLIPQLTVRIEKDCLK